jgi:beta-1,4-mannosyl-glycoprotein beta-1,4-N-acetylglucosaminyltransferase
VPRLYDCFLFFNELDLLEIRLNELEEVVDRFVLCESPYTFRGQPKPLHFHENRERFKRFLPKIEHVVVTDVPMGGPQTEHAYFRKERFQRNALRRGLASAVAEDFIILSDVDEIPRASAVRAIAHEDGPNRIHVLEMEQRDFFLNLRTGTWNKARMVRLGDIRRLQTLRVAGPGWRPNSLRPGRLLRQWRRMTFGIRPRPWIRVPDAGWHFKSMNGPAAVRAKHAAYAHVRPRMEDETEVEREIAKTLAAAIAGKGFARIAAFTELPAFVAANRERFAHLIADSDTLMRYGVARR